MSSPVSLTSTVGVSKDHLEYGPFRKWLKPIRVRATVHPDLSKAPEVIGEAFGFSICRDAIRQTFHKSMEPPHEETMNLAITIFDRFGKLNKEIVEHPIRKGSGVWKEEVNEGDIVLIENVYVNKTWRKKGVGTKLVLHLLEKAMASRHNSRCAFTRPAAFYDETKEEAIRGQKEEQIQSLHRSNTAAVVSFFRSMQFRRVGVTEWFALARDEKHPSRQLSRTNDTDPVSNDLSDSDSDHDSEVILCGISTKEDGTASEFTQTRHLKSGPAPPGLESLFESSDATTKEVRGSCAAIMKRRWPLHYAIKVLADKDCLEFLKSHIQNNSDENFDGEAVNGNGDTILHIAAKASKSASLNWIVESPIGVELATMRNREGYTPLESLKAQLEYERISKPYGFSRRICVADKFDGFEDNAVACLLKLTGIEAPTDEQRDVAKFGCSCGQCIRGFLSPRMIEKLVSEAAMIYDVLAYDPKSDGKTWCMAHKDIISYLPGSLQTYFQRHKASREAFIDLMAAVANCLADKVVPHSASVIDRLRSTSIWSQIDAHYFQKGGTVAAAVNTVIDKARMDDVENDGCLSELPNCRNDHEFEFVRRRFVDNTIPRTSPEGTEFPVEMPWLPQMMRMRLLGQNYFDHIG